MVRMTGLEPARVASLAPKASASTISPHPRKTALFYVILGSNASRGPGYSARIRLSCAP